MKEAVTILPVQSAARVRGLRWLVPSLADFLFGAFLIWLFVTGEGWKSLLGDGDCGWHIRTGDYILAQGHVPRVDIFSYTKPGQPWFAWEWLSDVTFSALHQDLGLKGVVLLAGVVLAATATILFQHTLWSGANLFIALLVTLLAMGSASIHYLARPHIFTLLMVTISLWFLARDRRRPGWTVWLLVPLAALWANLHGGFLALISATGLLAAASLLEGWLAGPAAPDRWTNFRRYATLTAACSLATLANPYGYQLHVHIARYLRSSWILEAVEEFQSPKFRSENMLQFEALLFAGLGLVGWLLFKKRWFEALLILFWAQAALTSVRHAPIFAIAAAPILASELTAIWNRWVTDKPRRSVMGILRDLSNEFGRLPLRVTLWAPALVLFLAVAKGQNWPSDFPSIKFPVAVIDRHAALLAPAEGPMPRILTSDQWGDYLIYRFYPRMRVFVDGRSDFYGQEFGKEYMQLAGAQHRWEAILERYRFDYALVPVEWPLAELLKRRVGWRLVADDGLAILFEAPRAALMKVGHPAERKERHSRGTTAPRGSSQ